MFSIKRRKPQSAVRVITLVPQSHAGRDGFEARIDGQRVAWGATETAAVANAQMSAIPRQRVAS